MKYLLYFYRTNDEIIEKIEAKLKEKKNENFIENKWELNGYVNFSKDKAESFYTEILGLVLDVDRTIDEKEEVYLMNAVYGNGFFHELTEPDEEGVFIEGVYIQYIDMFMTKFRGILFDFKRELIWSFKCIFLLN